MFCSVFFWVEEFYSVNFFISSYLQSVEKIKQVDVCFWVFCNGQSGSLLSGVWAGSKFEDQSEHMILGSKSKFYANKRSSR